MNMEDFIEKLEKLTPKKQTAICWLMENTEIADELCKGKKLTKEQIERYTKYAEEKDDYLFLLLVKYKQMKDAGK